MKITRDDILYDDGTHAATGYYNKQGEKGLSRDTPCLWFPVLVGFSFLWLLLNAYFNDNYGESLIHCSLFWHGSEQMTVLSPTTRVSAACVLTRKDELAKLVSKWERSFFCVSIEQVRRTWREETGSVWTGNEVEDHRNKRMSMFVWRHQFQQVPWHFTKKQYVKFEIQRLVNLCWAQKATVLSGQYLPTY